MAGILHSHPGGAGGNGSYFCDISGSCSLPQVLSCDFLPCPPQLCHRWNLGGRSFGRCFLCICSSASLFSSASHPLCITNAEMDRLARGRNRAHLASLYLDTKFVSLHNHLLHDTLLNGFLVFVSRLNDNKKSNSLSGWSLRESPEGLEDQFPILNGNGLHTQEGHPALYFKIAWCMQP